MATISEIRLMWMVVTRYESRSPVIKHDHMFWKVKKGVEREMYSVIYYFNLIYRLM